MSGFHLQSAFFNIVKSYVDFLEKTIKPKIMVPLHCSGEKFTSLPATTGIKTIVAGSGDIIDI